jgi:hypothetical protein
MKPRHLSLGLVAALCFCAGTAGVARERAGARSSKPALDRGMSAAEVKAIVGQPLQVRPMKTAEGNAEVWTYRRELENHTRQTATQIEFVPAFSGIGATGQSMIRTRPQEVYSLENIVTDQVTELLMFDGQLVKGKQWNESRRSYQ